MCRGQRPARGGPTPGQPSALQQSPCRGLLPPPVPRDSRPRAGLGAKPHSRHWQSALFLKGPPQVTRRHHPAASSPGLRARVGKVQTAPPAPASRPHPCTGTCVAPAPVALLEAPKFHPCLFWKCAETRGAQFPAPSARSHLLPQFARTKSPRLWLPCPPGMSPPQKSGRLGERQAPPRPEGSCGQDRAPPAGGCGKDRGAGARADDSGTKGRRTPPLSIFFHVYFLFFCKMSRFFHNL